MRIKINHLNIGMFYEAYLVCTSEHEDYFRAVAKELEAKHAARTGVFVYDKEELTPQIRRRLRTCSNILFMLTNKEPDDAARDESHPFRKVFAYADSKNPHSISLVAINGCVVDYKLRFPKDMQSFDWLHRKSYDICNSTPENTADEFFKELRYKHNDSVKQKLVKLNAMGLTLTRKIYLTLALMSILSILFFLNIFSSIDTSLPGVSDIIAPLILGLIALLMIAALICSGMIPVIWLSHLDRLYDTSVVFTDFRYLLRKRLTIICSLAAGAAFSEFYTNGITTSDMNAWLIPFILIFAYSSAMLVLIHSCPNYITFAVRRNKARLYALPLIIAGAVTFFCML